MSFVYLSMAVFALGLYGVLSRRDIVAVLASVEVMLGAAMLLLVGLASISTVGQQAADAGRIGSVGLVIIVLAAAEASVGLALAITVVRRRRTTRLDELTEVRG